jgi:hypothetical protein
MARTAMPVSVVTRTSSASCTAIGIRIRASAIHHGANALSPARLRTGRYTVCDRENECEGRREEHAAMGIERRSEIRRLGEVCHPPGKLHLMGIGPMRPLLLRRVGMDIGWGKRRGAKSVLDSFSADIQGLSPRQQKPES